MLFRVCDKKNRFVYEVCPEYFGDSLTSDEVEYWEAYDIIEIAKIEDVDWLNLDLEETVDEILRINMKRKAEIRSLKRKL